MQCAILLRKLWWSILGKKVSFLFKDTLLILAFFINGNFPASPHFTKKFVNAKHIFFRSGKKYHKNKYQ